MVKQTRGRALVLSVILCLGAGLLCGRLLQVQLFEREQFRNLIPQDSSQTPVILPRGRIWDKSGFLLAGNEYRWEISATPRLITDTAEIADRLAPLLDRPRDEVMADLSQKNERWVLLAREVPLAVGQAILAMGYRGITGTARPYRVYPERDLAAHLLGFTIYDNHGYYGVEGYYDQVLSYTPGDLLPDRQPWLVSWGARLSPRLAVQSSYAPDLVLTVDRTVQKVVERALQQAVVNYQAKSGTIIVIKPDTGAVLAMANYPTFDLNKFSTTPPQLHPNPAISHYYEPGSVLKVMTMAAGLDTGKITPHTQIHDPGSVDIGGQRIWNADRQAHGLVDMTDVLVWSLNVGAVHVAQLLGPDDFYLYLKRFGFGRVTEVDLAGEGPGSVRTPGNPWWSPSDLATNSYGQGIDVTPLQVVMAVAAVANDGVLMKPYVVHSVVRGQEEREVRPVPVRRVISSETARTLTQMMVQVVEREATLARVEGYQVAGKTGTAEIPEATSYSDRVIASFAGFLPADDPQLVILVKIDEPQIGRGGDRVAAPVFAEVAGELVRLLNIPPDNVRMALRQATGN